MTQSGGLLWSGEHWIAYLRQPGEESSCASVGVYHTRWSPAGEGNVALIHIEGENGFSAAVADNRAVYDFTVERVRAAAPDDPFNDLDLPLLDGSVVRGGDVRSAPYWLITAGGRTVVATWSDLVTPFIMTGKAAERSGRGRSLLRPHLQRRRLHRPRRRTGPRRPLHQGGLEAHNRPERPGELILLRPRRDLHSRVTPTPRTTEPHLFPPRVTLPPPPRRVRVGVRVSSPSTNTEAHKWT